MKKVLFCITAILIAVTLTACSGNKQANLKIIDLSDYTIIYSASASAEEIASANELSNITGGITVSDDIKTPDTGNRKEILIGATNRAETASNSEKIKQLDYTVEYIDGRFIICGGGSESTSAAVNHFISNNLSDDKKTASTMIASYNHTYDIEKLAVDDTVFECFNIITSLTDGSLNTKVNEFSGKLTDKSGLSDTNHGHALNIMLKTDSEIGADSFVIKVAENDISLIGANLYGINAAIDCFFNTLVSDGSLALNNGDIFEGKVEKKEEKYSKYITERTPLSNTYKRLADDKEVNIVYFGGSVTAGYGASSNDNSWREMIGKWFETTFSGAKINNYNSSIGSSGSMLGAFRCEHDVTALSPDLMFIEFAANDMYCQTSPEDISAYYEYIIRTIKKSNPNCDIVALYITEQTEARISGNKPIEEATIQDSICKYYGISSISIGEALCSDFDYTSDTEWQKYFIDIVHPTDLGYEVYYNVIREYLESNLIYGDASIENNPEYTLPNKLSDTEFNPKFILPDDIEVIENIGWEYSSSPYRETANPYETYLYPTSSQNKLTIKFNGHHAALMAQYSIDNRLTYSFDGNNEKIQNQKSNLPLLLEAPMNEESDEHTLTLSVTINDSTTPYIIEALLVW